MAEEDTYAEPYESTQALSHLPEHLERIAQRDYCGVNEGYWILRDAALYIRRLQEACQQIVDRYDDVNLNHVDFRVGAFAVALDAFERPDTATASGTLNTNGESNNGPA